jgi:hypothetical protein
MHRSFINKKEQNGENSSPFCSVKVIDALFSAALEKGGSPQR